MDSRGWWTYKRGDTKVYPFLAAPRPRIPSSPPRPCIPVPILASPSPSSRPRPHPRPRVPVLASPSSRPRPRIPVLASPSRPVLVPVVGCWHGGRRGVDVEVAWWGSRSRWHGGGRHCRCRVRVVVDDVAWRGATSRRRSSRWRSSRWHPRRRRHRVVVVLDVALSSSSWCPRHRGVVEAGWAGVFAGAVVLAFAGVRAVVVGSVKVGGSSLSSWCRRRP
jgi:hypothetical protein